MNVLQLLPRHWVLFVRSIDVTTQYVQERQAFGQAIGQFQNTRFVLAQAKIDELATAAFYNQNVELYMQGKLDVETAAALKSFATDMQMKVADQIATTVWRLWLYDGISNFSFLC